MANKKLRLGMLVFALVFGLTVIGCHSDTDDDNPYVGTWVGSFPWYVPGESDGDFVKLKER